MTRMLAVSDAQRGLLLLMTLPDLEIAVSSDRLRSPGRLAAGQWLFCAERAEGVVHALGKNTLQTERVIPCAPETEALLSSPDGGGLYALSGAANCVQLLHAQSGVLLTSAQTGLYPRSLSLLPDGKTLAVADGAACRVSLWQAETLRPVSTLRTEGIACGAAWFAGFLYALCAEGEYDLRTIVGFFDGAGRFQPQVALPGLPGAMTACGGGLLVGHLGCLSMLDAPNGRIRWQSSVRGLPTQLVPLGRVAAFADETDGQVGLIDLRRGKILRRIQLDCPAGLAEII